MKIYRFNKILVAAALLLFVSQATPSELHKSTPDYNKPSQEMLEVLHEAEKDRFSVPFQRTTDGGYAWQEKQEKDEPIQKDSPLETKRKEEARKRRDEAEKKLSALEARRQEELREAEREDREAIEEIRKRRKMRRLREARIRSEGLGFGKAVPIVDDTNYLRSMFDKEQRRKSGESRTPLAVESEKTVALEAVADQLRPYVEEAD